MHRLWEVEDVVLEILERCPSSAEVSALGRTCRALFTIAMDVLWSGKYPIAPRAMLRPLGAPWEPKTPRWPRYNSSWDYLQSAPVDIPPPWASSKGRRKTIQTAMTKFAKRLIGRKDGKIAKEPQEYNSDRFVFYIQRMKELELRDEHWELLWMDTLTLLRSSLCSGTSSFSRLRSLRIFAAYPSTLITLSSYPWPELTFLSLRLRHAPGWSARSDIHSWYLFNEPTVKLPRLDELIITGSGWQEDEDDPAQLLKSVCTTHSQISQLALQHVLFRADSLQTTSGFRNLRSLRVICSSWEVNGCEIDLQYLERLELICRLDVDRTLLGFLKAINAPACSHLLLSCGVFGEWSPPTSPDTVKELATFLTSEYSALRYFYYYEVSTPPDVPALHPRSFETFTSLLSLSLIEVVIVSDWAELAVTDDHIDLISRSWPDLRKLVVRGRIETPPRTASTAVTFHGLTALSSRCSLIESLGLVVKFPGPDEGWSEVMPSCNSQAAVKTLDIFRSRISDPFIATALLKRTFPNLQRLRYFGGESLLNDTFPPIFPRSSPWGFPWGYQDVEEELEQRNYSYVARSIRWAADRAHRRHRMLYP
ncbi:hypothetical protein CALCODRAFT_493409 [Calocera cornea HHB12733]|uniref:F-box domain-containing protein n=1 Tax=Calocera cornea HHB12733 TaxID=1353952 RepID=A0A165HSE5_9BASI|nr:hypothetical protein CALCODRAFT_493409 [Calocera cornea HHB12733]